MAILFLVIWILAGMVVYYFEYTPAPKDASGKDRRRFAVGDSLIGSSIIISGVVLMVLDDKALSPLFDRLGGFDLLAMVAAMVGVPFLLCWLVRVVKRKVLSRKAQ